jgi:penicillin-binding protein 1C
LQCLKSKANWRRRSIRLLATIPPAALLGWFALPFTVALPKSLLTDGVSSPVLLDRHGTAISHLTLPDASRNAITPLEQIPADLIACTLAAEDKRFNQHGGIDLLANLRAGRDCLLQWRVVSGASTITQQLVKISSPPAKRTLPTKVREALAARRLEMTWTKSQILEAYLNRLDYGNLRIGSAEAARFYFQKPLADLSLAECALIAGLPQAPSRLNPVRNLQRATTRRNTVLQRLAASGKQDPERVAAAMAESIRLRPLPERQVAPWLIHQPSTARPSPIRTTLDLALQRDFEAIVREETAKLKAAELRHAAVIAIDNPTGEILAWVSSADWSDPRGGQLNGALVPRSPGSTLKPFTYLLALEYNHRIPSSILADIPTPFRTPQGLDLPENYDRAYRGPVTLRSALACSLNVPALRELNTLGGPRPLAKFLEALGISTLGANPSDHGLGLTLGNAPVRLLELTNAYATLARQGRHRPPTLFLPAAPVSEPILFSPQTAYLIADILADSAARAPAFPPGGPLDLPFPCAVKTGTSSDYHDNWCMGFTPRFTVGVWAGNFEQRPMKGLSGIAGAGPIFHRAMLRLHQSVAPTWFSPPAGIRTITIDPRNGKRVPAVAPLARADLSPSGSLPPPASAADYDPAGKAWLDPTYAEWFASRHNLRRGELTLSSDRAPHEPLRIISPANHATFLLDPEIPSGSDKLRPVTNLPGLTHWHSDTLHIEPAAPEPLIHLTIGNHILTVTDTTTGTTQTLKLSVKSL